MAVPVVWSQWVGIGLGSSQRWLYCLLMQCPHPLHSGTCVALEVAEHYPQQSQEQSHVIVERHKMNGMPNSNIPALLICNET